MRLDKYLKVSRLIKRRTIAKEASNAGRILVNGKKAKASYEVEIDDEVVISLGNREIKVKVKKITEHSTKDDANLMYEIIS